MRENGYTLTELLVVITIIGILAVSLGFSYIGWQGKYRVESQVKQLYSDMMDARSRAMQRGFTYLMDFPTPTTYRVLEDSDNNGAVSGGDQVLPMYPKASEFTITWPGGEIRFDRRGIVQPFATLPDGTAVLTINHSPDTDPDYNCISISQTRINTGKMNGANCNAG